MSQTAGVRNQVFVSYSHSDDAYLRRLRDHLKLLERRNIRVWTDKDIEPGMDWRSEIEKALASTRVAVLLISTDFLNSDFITRDELPPLLEAAKTEGAEIVPVIVQPSLFGDEDLVPISKYQAVNMGRPLAKLRDAELEDEYVRIFQVIRKKMEGTPVGPPTAAAAPGGSAPAGTAAARPTAAGPAPATARPVGAAAAEPPPAADDGEEEVPLEEGLVAALQAMADAPGAQSLTIQAVSGDDAVELMLVTEGRDGSMLVELLANDELPKDFRLPREAQRHVVEALGFNPPERRGDRFWALYGDNGEEVDLEAVTADIVAVLEEVFDLPNEDIAIAWQVLEN